MNPGTRMARRCLTVKTPQPPSMKASVFSLMLGSYREFRGVTMRYGPFPAA
jgi:hypothetical protein